MWTYEQLTGYLIAADGAQLEPPGYAGHGDGVNNPAYQDDPDIGPIPQGRYAMLPPEDSAHCGRFAIELVPDPANKMFGRSGFFIHGDEISNPGQHHASDGCIVQTLASRMAAWNSGDHVLEVVSGRAQA